ncbi:hypothetical protein Ahy_A07g036137 [Arachis hypogaea]|uniref:Aminotransferase-like plant mobile domain-containing protein n=1 Tax=Arachis hypogaea TaxID=3818 RepID=A0A445CFB9_ARAHY|nr:hypothetical protein Ahy_A07g036137 [Arachis hypogaea]
MEDAWQAHINIRPACFKLWSQLLQGMRTHGEPHQHAPCVFQAMEPTFAGRWIRASFGQHGACKFLAPRSMRVNCMSARRKHTYCGNTRHSRLKSSSPSFKRVGSEEKIYKEMFLSLESEEKLNKRFFNANRTSCPVNLIHRKCDIRIGKIKRHSALLVALMERWRVGAHTFVLSVDEVMVTLKDVAHIYGLPIDGNLVTGWTDSSHDFLVNHNLAIFEQQTHCECHIFCQLGTTLFADKLMGATTLSHLYRSLCPASWYDFKEMDNSLNLLFSHLPRNRARMSRSTASFRQEIYYMDEFVCGR